MVFPFGSGKRPSTTRDSGMDILPSPRVLFWIMVREKDPILMPLPLFSRFSIIRSFLERSTKKP